MLQQEKPDDYVIASGETRTVREFAQTAFAHAGMDIEWHGEGADEYGVDRKSGKTIIKVNPEFFRPAEVDILLGDASKAEKVLGWKREISFEQLVQRMVNADMERISKL